MNRISPALKKPLTYILPEMIAFLVPLATAIMLLWKYVGPLNGFWSGDQGVKLIQVQSILLNKMRTTALLYPGAAFDPKNEVNPLRGQYLVHNGSTYSMFSDTFAVLSSIPFFFFGYPGLYILPALSLAVLGLICVRISRPLLGPYAAVVVALAITLTSPILFYSVIFWEHLPATALVVLGVWQALEAHVNRDRRRALIAGIGIGFATWLRNESVLAAPALVGAILLTRRPNALSTAFWISIGVAISLLPLMIYNQIVFGAFVGPHVLVAGAANNAGGNFFVSRLDWASRLIAPLDSSIFVGILIMLALSTIVTMLRHTPEVITIGLTFVIVLSVFTATLIRAMPGSGIQTNLLTTFPVILLCLLPVPLNRMNRMAERSDEPSILLMFGVGFILCAWLIRLPDGGAQWGPRMLLSAIPPLAIAGAWRAFYWLNRPAARLAVAGITAILLFAALLSQIEGLRNLRDSNVRNHALLTTVDQSHARIVICDTAYGPPLLAPIFYDGRLIFLIDDGHDLDYLIEQLEVAGLNTFYYLSRRSNTIAASSQRWQDLTVIGESANLPHYLTGQMYRIGRTTLSEPKGMTSFGSVVAP